MAGHDQQWIVGWPRASATRYRKLVVRIEGAGCHLIIIQALKQQDAVRIIARAETEANMLIFNQLSITLAHKGTTSRKTLDRTGGESRGDVHAHLAGPRINSTGSVSVAVGAHKNLPLDRRV